MTQTTHTQSNKIYTHFSSHDFYKYYKDNSSTPVDRKVYDKVKDEFNKAIVDLVINKGLTYTLPYLGLDLCVRKVKREPEFKDGKLVNKIPVDFKATKELWAIDEEAKENKVLVRYRNTHSDKYIYYIRMIKNAYQYNNKKYYTFRPARDFKRDLAARIKDDTKEPFNTFLLY